MRIWLIFAFILVSIGSGLFLFWRASNEVVLAPGEPILSVPEANPSPPGLPQPPVLPADIENQKPLTNSPEVIKAVYATSWSAASPSKLNYLISLIRTTELNAIVIDIKAFDGYVAYDIKNQEVERYGAKEVRIPRINALIKRLHDEGIYVIARITIFQDPVLAKARPDLTLHSSSTGGLWYDRKGLAWIDPAAKEAWSYNIAIAKDAAERGFDELNFDYIRFASDGDLNDVIYPFYNPATTYKQSVIKDFFSALRSELKGTVISADLFGLATVNHDDLGIGQNIEDAYSAFDFVSPMVYPSHYASDFLGYKNPAAFPYEVVKYSMENAFQRLIVFNQQTASTTAKLRPWLQDFDLGADYTAELVRKEIQAVYDAGLNDGWMLWNPSNIYTREALLSE